MSSGTIEEAATANIKHICTLIDQIYVQVDMSLKFKGLIFGKTMRFIMPKIENIKSLDFARSYHISWLH